MPKANQFYLAQLVNKFLDTGMGAAKKVTQQVNDASLKVHVNVMNSKPVSDITTFFGSPGFDTATGIPGLTLKNMRGARAHYTKLPEALKSTYKQRVVNRTLNAVDASEYGDIGERVFGNRKVGRGLAAIPAAALPAGAIMGTAVPGTGEAAALFTGSAIKGIGRHINASKPLSSASIAMKNKFTSTLDRYDRMKAFKAQLNTKIATVIQRMALGAAAGGLLGSTLPNGRPKPVEGAVLGAVLGPAIIGRSASDIERAAARKAKIEHALEHVDHKVDNAVHGVKTVAHKVHKHFKTHHEKQFLTGLGFGSGVVGAGAVIHAHKQQQAYTDVGIRNPGQPGENNVEQISTNRDF